MRRAAHSAFLVVLIALFTPQRGFAYEYPLSSGSIRDAYFLGKENATKREAFFATYTHHFARPRTGPYVSLVRVSTPFAFVVERTARALPNFLAPDAQQRFFGKPVALRVRVRIDLTPTYGWQVRSPKGGVRLRKPDFWRQFNVQLIQRKPIEPVAEFGEADYSFATGGSSSVLVGADIEIEYDPEDVRSAPATIVVETPDGKQIQVTFDLQNLR